MQEESRYIIGTKNLPRCKYRGNFREMKEQKSGIDKRKNLKMFITVCLIISYRNNLWIIKYVCKFQGKSNII